MELPPAFMMMGTGSAIGIATAIRIREEAYQRV
jgi:hypothetical protein